MLASIRSGREFGNKHDAAFLGQRGGMVPRGESSDVGTVVQVNGLAVRGAVDYAHCWVDLLVRKL